MLPLLRSPCPSTPTLLPSPPPLISSLPPPARRPNAPWPSPSDSARYPAGNSITVLLLIHSVCLPPPLFFHLCFLSFLSPLSVFLFTPSHLSSPPPPSSSHFCLPRYMTASEYRLVNYTSLSVDSKPVPVAANGDAGFEKKLAGSPSM